MVSVHFNNLFRQQQRPISSQRPRLSVHATIAAPRCMRVRGGPTQQQTFAHRLYGGRTAQASMMDALPVDGVGGAVRRFATIGVSVVQDEVSAVRVAQTICNIKRTKS